MNDPTIAQAVKMLRTYQRHRLLREFGDNGLVLAENLDVSQCLDVVIKAAEKLTVNG